ncbi:hypothetical protein [Saccharomonospora sp. CUA-673]|uniref:hypothetical protein n=1 Tax=Saccharomonospora sp. CUA-673 TaxID=1904969 RepID=UPI001651273E|nr:hypothetical protein [Saccharomonospora sp. CUA-673]
MGDAGHGRDEQQHGDDDGLEGGLDGEGWAGRARSAGDIGGLSDSRVGGERLTEKQHRRGEQPTLVDSSAVFTPTAQHSDAEAQHGDAER